MYDVSSRSSFEELIKWFREIDTYCSEDVVKIIVGNKVDKVGASMDTVDHQEFSRQVTKDEGQAFAERMGTLFVGVFIISIQLTAECSAKTNLHVTDAFQELVRRVSPYYCGPDKQILATPSLWTRGPQPVRTQPVALTEESSGMLGGCSC